MSLHICLTFIPALQDELLLIADSASFTTNQNPKTPAVHYGNNASLKNREDFKTTLAASLIV